MALCDRARRAASKTMPSRPIPPVISFGARRSIIVKKRRGAFAARFKSRRVAGIQKKPVRTHAFNWQTDHRHFRDYPLTGHDADMPKSTHMTQAVWKRFSSPKN